MLISPFILLYLFLPVGRECPRCSGETIAIRTWASRPLRAMGSRRWCMECGWEGIARNAVAGQPLPRLEVVPDDSEESGENSSWKPES
jgi:hypothetical protein